MPRTKTDIIPLVIASALFMQHIDGSIIATALPKIAQSLNTDPLHLNLAITSYMLSLAIFIPLSGWVADRFGARQVFCAAMAAFMVGSMACGAANSLGELVAARLIQGVGGAMMVPVGRLIMLRSIPKSQFVDAMALYATPALIGPILGPPLGGLIVTYASWRWIFFVNAPICLLGIYLARKHIGDIRAEATDRIDLRGFVLSALALCGLVAAFETVGRGIVPLPVVAACFSVGLCCSVLYFSHARGCDTPIIDFALLRFPTFRISLVGGAFFRLALGALPFLMPLLLQLGFGLTPATSGLISLATAIGGISMKPMSVPILRGYGFRTTLMACAIGNAAFFALMPLFTSPSWLPVMFAFLLLGGLMQSLQFTALNTVAFADIPERLLSRANSFYSMAQQLMLSLGVATGAAVLNLTQHFSGRQQLTTAGFAPAFAVAALFCVASALCFWPLSPRAGAEMSGHRGPDTRTDLGREDS